MIYKDQLSCHDSLMVNPKQPPQLNQCHDLVCVPGQSSLAVQKVGNPITESQQQNKENKFVTKIVPMMNKNQGRKVGSKNKYKKDALPELAVAKPFIIKLEIASNTNKKAKVHNPNIDNNTSNVVIEEVKPFETVFARMEKRRMGLKMMTINSPHKKPRKRMYRNMIPMTITMMELAMTIMMMELVMTMMKSMMKLLMMKWGMMKLAMMKWMSMKSMLKKIM